MEEIAHQKWYIYISNSSMCITYKLFKKQLHIEKHLLNSNFKDRINMLPSYFQSPTSHVYAESDIIYQLVHRKNIISVNNKFIMQKIIERSHSLTGFSK